MATSDDRIVRLVDQQAGRRAQILNQLIALIKRLLGRVDWYNEPQVQAFTEQASLLTRSAQTATGAVTVAYLVRALSQVGVQTQGRGGSLLADLRGVPQEEVWERLAKEFRYLRSEGIDQATATERVVQRAGLIADDDVALAMRTTARDVLEPITEVIGYRRVIHPELSREGACGLCIVASDRIYTKADLLPMHSRCKCEVLPVISGGVDPGRFLNASELARFYKEADGNTRDKLKATRYQIDIHGELGPVLRTAGHNFRDLADTIADTRN